MKTSTLIIISLSLIAIGCSTTTYLNLKATYPKYVEKEINKVEREKGEGVEVEILLINGNEVNGELLSVRDSTMILSAKNTHIEEELANLTYPVSLISNKEIQQLTIEGSSWVWPGIAAGAVVGALARWKMEDSGGSDVLKTIVPWGIFAAGWGIGYALSKEEYLIQEIPPDYDWSFLKPLTRYPDKEPEYLREIK